ncbi:hypothetical protein J5I95_09685 [Candidatus Poribacteria bacterium]|nr:hypothetical protein [Candidatus Poribacteria bacterium]
MTLIQHLFQCPKPIHRLHQFTRQDQCFIVDLDVGQVLETDDLIWEILQLCPESTEDEILEALSKRYTPDRIYQAFEQLRGFEEMGLLVGDTGREMLKKKNRLRIFVAGPIEMWTSDKTYVRSGYRLASKEILSALSKYADLFSMTQNRRSFQTGFTPFPEAPQDITSYFNFSKTKLMGFSCP